MGRETNQFMSFLMASERQSNGMKDTMMSDAMLTGGHSCAPQCLHASEAFAAVHQEQAAEGAR